MLVDINNRGVRHNQAQGQFEYMYMYMYMGASACGRMSRHESVHLSEAGRKLMPRYDYKCTVCGITFEAITPADQQTLPCIACQDPQLSPFVIAVKQLCYPASIHVH